MESNMWVHVRFGVFLFYVLLALALALHSIFYQSTIIEPRSDLSVPSLAKQDTLASDITSLVSYRLAKTIDPGSSPSPHLMALLLTVRLNPPKPQLVYNMFIYLLNWIQLQFSLMENSARVCLSVGAIYGPYKLAALVFKNARCMYMDLCKEHTGPAGHYDSACLYCWDNIRANQRSIEHVQCGTYTHQDCLREWVEKGAATVATCPKCCGPLSQEDRCVLRGASVVSLSDLLLTGKRCALVAVCSALLMICALVSVDNNLPLEVQPAIRILGLTTVSSAIWLGLVLKCHLAWLKERLALRWHLTMRKRPMEYLAALIEDLPVFLFICVWQYFSPISWEACFWMIVGGHFGLERAMLLLAHRQRFTNELGGGRMEPVTRLLTKVARVAVVWLW